MEIASELGGWMDGWMGEGVREWMWSVARRPHIPTTDGLRFGRAALSPPPHSELSCVICQVLFRSLCLVQNLLQPEDCVHNVDGLIVVSVDNLGKGAAGVNLSLGLVDEDLQERDNVDDLKGGRKEGRKEGKNQTHT